VGNAFLQVREFLYLNSDLVDQFLAQLDDGLYDEVAERNRSTGDRKFEAGVGAGGAKIGGGKGSSHETETARTRRQTPESRFNRLMEIMETNPDYGLLSADDASVDLYDAAIPGVLLRAEGYVDVPQFSRMLARVDDLLPLLEIGRMLGMEGTEGITNDQIKMASVLSDSSNAVVAAAELAEDQPRLVFKLLNRFVRADFEAMEGEATVFGKVQRRWPRGETYPLLAVPGLDVLSRADRRKMPKSGQDAPDSNSTTIEGPGITLSVVAIFR